MADSLTGDHDVDVPAIWTGPCQATRVSTHRADARHAPTRAAKPQTRATESFNASHLNGGRSSESDHPRARLRRGIGTAKSGGELACARTENRHADRMTESASDFRPFQEYVVACVPLATHHTR
jgi:hypothetical protein